MVLEANRVFVAQSEVADYAARADSSPAELPGHTELTTALRLLRNLFRDAGLDSARYGTADWNPLGDVIDAGARVVLKPNWVLDENKLPGGGIDCLLTHASVIEAVLHYTVKAKPKSIIVGDAPLQSCDFENLRRVCGLDEIRMRFKQLGHDVQIRDFRLTRINGLFREQERTEPNPDDYCLFDLGENSWLTPVTEKQAQFRVTDYDPDTLRENHHQGTHRYLIAREVLDADVVINLPKLKTHRKAGVTGALKNMVGINGFKEYLPHHRKGGSNAGGDCYQGAGWLKSVAEGLLDRANRPKGAFSRYMNTRMAGLALRMDRVLLKGDGNLDGAWHGNDTVWRMCLDLQRILHYGKTDGRLSDTPRRKVLTITDAILAGDGEGPLAPSPVPLGSMTLGTNVAALEWIHCLLMQIDPRKIPLVARSFQDGNWPLANFRPEEITVCVNGQWLEDQDNLSRYSRRVQPPEGWRGHCEKDASQEQPIAEG